MSDRALSPDFASWEWRSSAMNAFDSEDHCAVCRVVAHGSAADREDLWAALVNLDRLLAESEKAERELIKALSS